MSFKIATLSSLCSKQFSAVAASSGKVECEDADEDAEGDLVGILDEGLEANLAFSVIRCLCTIKYMYVYIYVYI
jgi:hypothetical protein